MVKCSNIKCSFNKNKTCTNNKIIKNYDDNAFAILSDCEYCPKKSKENKK